MYDGPRVVHFELPAVKARSFMRGTANRVEESGSGSAEGEILAVGAFRAGSNKASYIDFLIGD